MCYSEEDWITVLGTTDAEEDYWIKERNKIKELKRKIEISKAITAVLNNNNENYGIYIEKGIRVQPSIISGIENFIVQANSQYLNERGHQTKKSVYRARYDSIEVKNEDNESEYYQVLTIITVVNLRTKEILGNILLICKYKILHCKTVLPYTQLMYEEGDPLKITTCDEQDISGPICVIPGREFLDHLYANPKIKHFVKDILRPIRMYSFDLKYIDRNAWGDFTNYYHRKDTITLQPSGKRKNQIEVDIDDDDDDVDDYYEDDGINNFLFNNRHLEKLIETKHLENIQLYVKDQEEDEED